MQLASYDEEHLPHPALVDMTGRKVGKLTVLARYIDHSSKTGSARWLCRCDCGTELVVRGSQLRHAISEGREPCCSCCRVRKEREPRVFKRKESPVCKLCGNMHHRVEGARCRRCGRVYIPERTLRAHEMPTRKN
jgi:hypothetical protein